MFDQHQLAVLRQEIAGAIEEGMKAGAAHIAEALAERTPKDAMMPGQVIMRAVKIVVESNTNKSQDGFDLIIGRTGRIPVAEQIEAWKTLRRALNLTV